MPLEFLIVLNQRWKDFFSLNRKTIHQALERRTLKASCIDNGPVDGTDPGRIEDDDSLQLFSTSLKRSYDLKVESLRAEASRVNGTALARCHHV